MEYLRSKEAQKYTDAARADVENTRLRHEQRKQFYKDYAKAKNRGERMDLFDKALEGDFLEPSDITAFTEGFQGVSPTGSDPGTINDLTKRRRDGEDVGGLAIKRHAQHLINDTDLKYFSDDSRNDSPGSWRQQARQALKAAFSGEDNDDPARQALFMELDKRLIGIAEQHPDWTNEKAKPVWNAVVALAQEIAPPPPANAVTKGGKIDEMATLKNNVDKWKESHPNGDMLEFKQTQEYKNLEKRMKEYLKYERLRDIYESAIRKGEQ
jgi:molecular chaperone GrpE (heat shock protein)